jgi:hypothetical protein
VPLQLIGGGDITMKISRENWEKFIKSFRHDLEQIDDRWKDIERPYRDWEGDVIDFDEYWNLNLWRVSNIIEYVIDYENSYFYEEGETIQQFAKMWINQSFDWDDFEDLHPQTYDQSEGHIALISLLLCEMAEDDPETHGVRPHVLERFNAFMAEN